MKHRKYRNKKYSTISVTHDTADRIRKIASKMNKPVHEVIALILDKFD